MFIRSELKARAKAAFAQQRSPLILAYVVIMLLTMLAMTPYYMGFMPSYGAMISQLQSDPMMLNQTHNPAATLGPLYFGLFAMIALLAIVFVIQVAFTGMALKALDRKPVELSELTSRTGEAGRWILLYLLMTVKIFLWSLLFVIPGIVAAMNYSQAIYLMLADPELKPADAIKQSIALIRGNRMRYFILQLSFILWNMLVSFTFGLAILYVGPYIELTNAAFFRELWALKNPAPPVAEVPANVIA